MKFNYIRPSKSVRFIRLVTHNPRRDHKEFENFIIKDKNHIDITAYSFDALEINQSIKYLQDLALSGPIHDLTNFSKFLSQTIENRIC